MYLRTLPNDLSLCQQVFPLPEREGGLSWWQLHADSHERRLFGHKSCWKCVPASDTQNMECVTGDSDSLTLSPLLPLGRCQRQTFFTPSRTSPDRRL